MNYRVYLEKSPPAEKGQFRARIDIQMRPRSRYKRVATCNGLTAGIALARASERLRQLEEDIKNPT